MFWALLILVSLGWALNVPGIVDVLRSRPLRPLLSLSYNRWSFAASQAILILAAIGLDGLRNFPRFRWWWSIPISVPAVFFGWCIYQLFGLTRQLDKFGFANHFLVGAGLAVIALVAWSLTFRTGPRAGWVRIAIIGLLPLELFGFAWDERRQADMKLYFPHIPILDQLAALPSGRIWGIGCLPPNFNVMCGLDDVRGYDAVDPRAFVKLFELASEHERSVYYPYARTLAALPAAHVTDHALKLHPVANLLNVRYLIFREPPRGDLPVLLHQDDYWILENRNALPRAYVPVSARVVKSEDEALTQMSGFDFDPRATALLTEDLGLPPTMRGTVSVRYETPARTLLEMDMQTEGLVLLSDRWDAGWRAELDGTPCPIYRVDVALRGFRVPAGKHSIVCTYYPPGMRKGCAIVPLELSFCSFGRPG